MPTVFTIDGFRFFFYSNEGTEPMHIHVEKGGASAKWWLAPVAMDSNDGFKPAQVRAVRSIIVENLERLVEAWNDHFEA